MVDSLYYLIGLLFFHILLLLCCYYFSIIIIIIIIIIITIIIIIIIIIIITIIINIMMENENTSLANILIPFLIMISGKGVKYYQILCFHFPSWYSTSWRFRLYLLCLLKNCQKAPIERTLTIFREIHAF